MTYAFTQGRADESGCAEDALSRFSGQVVQMQQPLNKVLYPAFNSSLAASGCPDRSVSSKLDADSKRLNNAASSRSWNAQSSSYFGSNAFGFSKDTHSSRCAAFSKPG